MLKIDVGRLLELHERLTVAKGNFRHALHVLTQAGAGQETNFSADDIRKIATDVEDLERIAKNSGLNSTAAAAERTHECLKQIPLSDPNFAGVRMTAEHCRTMSDHLFDIISRIRDECKMRLYFQIAVENADLLNPNAQHFGDAVDKAFAPATEDIAEAAKCLALECYTASVFHIMRPLEVATQTVADTIGAPIIDANGNGLPWGVIAANMKRKIDQMPKGSDQQIEWYKVQQSLEAVNRAWRVPTAHPKQTYTPQEARNVFEATKAFMQELASLV